MGLFGKSFEEKVEAALDDLRKRFPGARINAQIRDEDVTLTGSAPDLHTKGQIMTAFNEAVETKNTINQIAVDKPLSIPAGASFETLAGSTPTPAAAGARTHTVVSGDTLSALAKKYYGDASKHPRIFEANRDQLSDPDKIKVGQKLTIPG